MSIRNIAFYRFAPLPRSPEAWRADVRAQCEAGILKGTVILSPEGINGFLAGRPDATHAFESWLRGFPGFEDLEVKESFSQSAPFARLKIKLKREIIPFGRPQASPSVIQAPRLAPETLKAWLDSGRELLLLDTRNDYEVEKGTFEGAQHLNLRTFREFPEKFAQLPRTPARPMVMFCTGGIRCEKAAAWALHVGATEVYQLDGGILKYFERCGGAHYNRDCFVFDERTALTSELAPTLTEPSTGGAPG